MSSNIKRNYPSAQQKNLLIQLVDADPGLRSGKFSSSFTKKESEKRWMEISEKLNALSGAKKSWEGWRKTWQDRKSSAKKRFALARRQANITGGGPLPKPTDEDIIVLGTISQENLTGHADSQESLVEFIDLKTYQDFDKPAEVEEIKTVPEGSSGGITQNKRCLTRQKRLEKFLTAAENLNITLKEKINIKKNFYEKFLILMEKQTDALVKIADSLNSKT